MCDNIYNMNLGDSIREPYYVILRVAGGWIYTMDVGSNLSSVFVPFNNEFMNPSMELLEVKPIPIDDEYGTNNEN